MNASTIGGAASFELWGGHIYQSNIFSFNYSAPQWVAIPVTAQLSYSVANVTASNRFQLRIKTLVPYPGSGQTVGVYAADNATGKPYLRVKYILPPRPISIKYTNRQVRAFTGFDLSSIPAGTTVTASTLYLNCTTAKAAAGVSPILLDHVDYGTNLTGSDYSVTSWDPAFRSFVVPAAGWQKINVQNQVQYAVNNAKAWTKGGSSRWFQVRLRPTAVTGFSNDNGQFINSADDAAQKPYITVYYTSFVPLNITNKANLSGANVTNRFVTNIIPLTVSPPSISASKSVFGVTLNGATSPAVPGATVIYLVSYSNTSSGAGKGGLIYDRVATNMVFLTQSGGTATGWTMEWSTNQAPAQTYLSANYSAVMPTDKTRIKWIRWRKPLVTAYEKGNFVIRAVVK
jgi:hypothetical protein